MLRLYWGGRAEARLCNGPTLQHFQEMFPVEWASPRAEQWPHRSPSSVPALLCPWSSSQPKPHPACHHSTHCQLLCPEQPAWLSKAGWQEMVQCPLGSPCDVPVQARGYTMQNPEPYLSDC